MRQITPTQADVAARKAKEEEERRLRELEAIKRAAEERDYRCALRVCVLLLMFVGVFSGLSVCVCVPTFREKNDNMAIQIA